MRLKSRLIAVLVILGWTAFRSVCGADCGDAGEEQSQLIREIVALNGRYEHETTDPQSPVIKITLASITDSESLNALFRRMAKEKSVKELSLFKVRSSEVDFASLYGISSLCHLTLMSSDVSDACLKGLKNLENLETLDLTSNKVTDAGVQDHIIHLGKLKTLILGFNPITNRSVAVLARNKNLTDLYLDLTKIDDDAAETLAGMRNLRVLSLHYTSTSNASLSKLATMSNLERLDLGENVTDDGIPLLKPLKRLKTLGLQRTKVGAKGLKHLIAMEGLEGLMLSHPLDTEGYRNLAAMTQLRELWLGFGDVDGEMYRGLASLQQLRRLHLSSGENPANVDKLRKALPNCKIDNW